MIYRSSIHPAYIVNRQMQNSLKKGKTMTPQALIHVIWDFQVRIFNIAREKIGRINAEREAHDARWLNG
jgi:hypothetical protein